MKPSKGKARQWRQKSMRVLCHARAGLKNKLFSHEIAMNRKSHIGDEN